MVYNFVHNEYFKRVEVDMKTTCRTQNNSTMDTWTLD